MNKSVILLIGLAAGSVVGAASGILFAPNKGTKTRKKLMRKTKNMSKDFTKSMNKRIDDLEDRMHKIMANAEAKIHAETKRFKKDGHHVTAN